MGVWALLQELEAELRLTLPQGRRQPECTRRRHPSVKVLPNLRLEQVGIVSRKPMHRGDDHSKQRP
jgi:hypothetical protein